MNTTDRAEVKAMIAKGKDQGWGDVAFRLFLLLLITNIFLVPLAIKVIVPYWYEITKWAWLAPKLLE